MGLFVAATCHSKLLQHLKLHHGLSEVGVLVDGDADRRNHLGVVVVDMVVGDGTPVGPAAMLRVDGARKMPFYEGCPRHEGDIVEVEDLNGSSASWFSKAIPASEIFCKRMERGYVTDLEMELEFGLRSESGQRQFFDKVSRSPAPTLRSLSSIPR